MYSSSFLVKWKKVKIGETPQHLPEAVRNLIETSLKRLSYYSGEYFTSKAMLLGHL